MELDIKYTYKNPWKRRRDYEYETLAGRAQEKKK